MKDGLCPKCGSTEIYTDAELAEKANEYGVNKVIVKNNLLTNTYVEYNNLYCANCGYLERYIVKEADRDAIVKNWTRIGQE